MACDRPLSFWDLRVGTDSTIRRCQGTCLNHLLKGVGSSVLEFEIAALHPSSWRFRRGGVQRDRPRDHVSLGRVPRVEGLYEASERAPRAAGPASVPAAGPGGRRPGAGEALQIIASQVLVYTNPGFWQLRSNYRRAGNWWAQRGQGIPIGRNKQQQTST